MYSFLKKFLSYENLVVSLIACDFRVEYCLNILLKILLPVLLTAAAGLFGATFYTYEKGMDSLKETHVSLQKMAIANALVELRAGLDFNILNAISLAQTGILQPYLSTNMQLRMAYANDANSRIVNMKNTYYYVDIGIVSPSGETLDHTNKSYVGKDLSKDLFFQEAMEGRVSVSAPYRYKDMVVYAVASPVFSLEDDSIIGVVYNVSKLTDTMSDRMNLGNKGYLFVADKQGTVFIHKDTSQVLVRNLHDSDWGRKMLADGAGSITFSYDGREKLAYFDVLPETRWVAAAVLDLGEMAASGERVRLDVSFIAIVILLVLGIIIYIFVKNIVDALLKAVKYAEQVSQGVLDEDLNLGDSGKSITDRIELSLSLALARLRGKKIEEANDEKIYNLDQLQRKDELGTLYNALQVMVGSMRSMVQKADDASRMKSEFLANMSHEIRTPLNAVIGLAHLFLTSQEDEGKKRDYVQKIEVSGKSLLGIINNVLDTSKIEAGMFELDNTHFNLNEIGNQITTIYQDSASSKGLNLSYTLDPALGSHYTGDPVRLGQVLNNLVGNAIKFTESGSVTVEFLDAQNLVPECGIPEGFAPLCIKVKDSGIGISKEQEEQLFKPFAQADASITRRFGGTGLGLAISKQIVELMGGSLSVQSELGQGTTFTIVLFLQPAQDKNVKLAQEVEDEADHVTLRGKHILVVEDNMINQLIMEELLQRTEATVSMADNGQIAVDMVSHERFDLILMDMQMPVMDGIQATKIIRESYDQKVLPIIAVTANAMKEDKDKGIAVGLNDYLTKPVDPRNLMLVLHKWLCEE